MAEEEEGRQVRHVQNQSTHMPSVSSVVIEARESYFIY